MQVWIWSVSASKDQDFSHLIVTISAKPTPPSPSHLRPEKGERREKLRRERRRRKEVGAFGAYYIHKLGFSAFFIIS